MLEVILAGLDDVSEQILTLFPRVCEFPGRILAYPAQHRARRKRDETEGDYMAAVSGVRCAQGIARPVRPLRSTLTPATAAKALASRFNRAPPVAARPKQKP